MSDDPSRVGRRALLAGAGLAAAGVTGAVLASGDDDGAGPAAAAATPALDVRAFGARGDGRADDRAALQRALDAVPAEGGAVVVPPGDYLLSGPLAPRTGTLLQGVHVPHWRFGASPPASTRLRATADFAGPALIAPEDDAARVTLRGLLLTGDGAGRRVDGLRLPALGEASWALEALEVAGFTGSGITGTAHVAAVRGCFVHDNARWGIEIAGADRWLDVHVTECFVFANRLGGALFAGDQTSAAVDWVSCRFERGRDAGAPGLRLVNAALMSFVACSTDANPGAGIEVLQRGEVRPGRLTFAACRFQRDGTAGVVLRGSPGATVAEVAFAGCLVTAGTQDDRGGGPRVPPRGVVVEHTEQVSWVGGAVEAATPFAGSDNADLLLADPARGLGSLPTRRPEGELLPDGLAYVDGRRLVVRAEGAWRSVALE